MITTVTTVNTVGALGISVIISVIAVVTLLVFLFTRELVSPNNSRRPFRVVRFASVGILPLIIAFTAMSVVKIIELI